MYVPQKLKLKKQKILVTGAGGYLGSVICENLIYLGYHVTAVDNLMYGQRSLFHLCANSNFDFVYGDVRDKDLMGKLIKKADIIIPLAAIVGAPACERDKQLTESVNFKSIKLLNRLRSPQQLIVIPVTNSGYGTKSSAVYCTEESPLEPISLYGQTKVQAEEELLSSENAISLRLATVFGMSPRMRIDLLVNHFVYAAMTDGYIVIYEKDFTRNFIHIRDVADGFLHCITHSDQMTGQAYNLGLDDANLSKEELALKVKDKIPGFYLHFSEIGNDPDKRNYIVSNKRLREAGFVAKRSIDDGISELIKGYRMFGRNEFKNV